MNRMTFLHPLRNKPQTRWLLLLALLLLLGFGAALAVSRPGLASERTPAGGDQYAYLPFVPYEPVVPPPDTLSLVPFADGFSTTTITDIANAGDTRLFVLEREGVIRVVLANGTILPTPFLDIRDLVETSNWEQGLVGIAFHPHYSQNGYFYITFTERQLGLNNIRLYRFSVSADPNVADRGSAVRMMSIERPEQVHHAGDLNFGPDGYLYMGVGDGGPDPLPPDDPDAFPGDLYNRSQNLAVPMGSILRIDVDAQAGSAPDCGLGAFYTVPPGNPFVDGPGGNCDEIWAYGFRNPWRFSFDRVTGDMWIGDVGEWLREEIDLISAGTPAGGNYGWHCREGSMDYTAVWPEISGDCVGGTFLPPIIDYPRTQGCSVTGGFVYRGRDNYSLRGHYVFADFCNGHVWRAEYRPSGWEKVLLLDSPLTISTFGEDANGELYVGAYFDTKIYKVVAP